MVKKLRGWQPLVEPMAERSPRISPEVWAIAQACADAQTSTIASWVRQSLFAYLAQSTRIPSPPVRCGERRMPTRSVRASRTLWDKVAARALRDRTTISGVVGAAILYGNAVHAQQLADAAGVS
jgi:hypothetical protein